MLFSSYLTNWRCLSIFILGTVLVFCAHLANSAQVGRSFNVTVNLQKSLNSTPTGIFCRSSPALAFGAVITVVCSTGELVNISINPSTSDFSASHGSAYRFVLHDTESGFDTIDVFSSLGTVTTWHMRNLADRDYLEVLIGW